MRSPFALRGAHGRADNDVIGRSRPRALGGFAAAGATALAAALAVSVATALPAAAAGPSRTAAASAAAPAPLRLMPLGDSITWGVGSSTGDSYRSVLWNDLAAEGHSSLDFVGSGRNGSMADPDNEGHSGWRIDQIAGIADAVLAHYRPNVITLEIGTNDLNQNYQVPTATDRLHALVDQITADAPDATVLLASLIVSTNPVEEPNRPAFNQAVPGIVQAEQAAGRHVAYVDMGALTTADLADQLHPNDTGYAKMAAAFNAGVQAADSAGWIKPPVPTGGYVYSGIAGKCLDDALSSTANGNPVQLWGCDNTDAQWWTLHTDGTLRVFGKCVDAAAAGTANGTKVQLYDCNGTVAQVWQPYNGGYRNPNSGRCLDDPGSSTADGTQLQLYDCNGTNAQKWTTLTAV
ncbi:SGNH/GDSL hydrolase family protein [Actinacidiphila acididurans]|uniref:Ricin-type beta-trefoil lectin domain protein n=1 Tax=Actinacidiphila acididurans TaxID=2784346 RepID=A0ABS2TXW7_9ACTN|nr:SGNH/GDSL hydrolase family protein [Actinacidiphila acididurans]MBM9507811.1 ricin-type beta-trefoil lectin domain protein [Actinacidiphila acididurans]